jgi:xylulokinase
MHATNLLVFDLGTTNLKVSLFDMNLRMIGLRRMPTPARTEGDRSELATGALIKALLTAAAAIRHRWPREWREIGAVSWSSQANSFLLLDQNEQPLTPIVLWPDQRARGSESEMRRFSAMDDFCRTTGMPRIRTSAAVAKLLWLRQHEPQLWQRARRFCFISDWLTLWLTGMHLTEASIAGLSGLLDIEKLAWWENAIMRLDLPMDWLPPVRRAGEVVSTIRPHVAQQLGLAASTAVTIGCLDQYAAALGAGALDSTVICETTGTVLSAVRSAEEQRPAVRAAVYQGPGIRNGHWWQMTFSTTSANLLEWYRRQLPGPPGYDQLEAAAEEATSTAEILPLGDGEGIDSCFARVTPRHTPGEIVRGIMQRVAETLAEQVAALGGGPLREVRSTGGGARSRLWLRIKQDVLGVPVVAAAEESASRGAAMLARAGARSETWKP